MRAAVLVEVLALVLGCTAAAAQPDKPLETLNVSGVSRTYQLFVPGNAKPKAPLLLVLHGRLGSGSQVREHSGFDVEAGKLGVVVAYPDGIDHRWNDLRQLTLKSEKPRLNNDDVGFLLALVDALATQGLVDVNNVWVAGHSNGAIMALTLACVHAERFRGIAIVAGNLPQAECKPARPVQAIFFHGTEDPLIPYGGGGVGAFGRRGLVLSADDTVATFARAAGCQAAVKRAAVDAAPDDGTQLVVEDRAGCSVPVARVILEHAGHGWPGRPPQLSKGSQEIDASKAIASFFFEGKGP